MNELSEKTTHTEFIYRGKIINLQVDEVILPNGKKAKREIVKHPGAVAIIPITTDKKIVFVEQFRKPLERTLLEIPAGKVDEGEKPEITAIRELEEETGYTANSLTFVDSFYTSPGFADEHLDIFMTTDLKLLESNVPGDEDEFINIVELSLEEALEDMQQQRIHDAKTNYALLYLKSLGELTC